MKNVALALVVVVACAEPPAPVHEAPDVADAAPRRSTIAFSMTRRPGALELEGLLPRGALDPVRGRLDPLERALVVLTDVPADDAQVAAVTTLIEAGLILWRAELTVDGARLELDGTALTDGDAERVEAVAQKSGAVLGRVVATEIAVDTETLREGEGFVRPLGSPARLVLVDERETRRNPDERGRLEAGLYRIDGTDRWVAVAEGRTTWMPADPKTAPSIVIGGRRFLLDDDVRVIGGSEPGALDFASHRAGPDGMPTFGHRYVRPGVEADAEHVLTHRDFIHQVVLHTDLTPDSRAAFDVLLSKSLSDHFAIDWDGTIYQMLDVVWCAYHAGEANPRSIAVTLNNLMANLESKPRAPAWPKTHPRRAEMGGPGFERSESEVMSINGALVRSWGYTPAQYRALGSLLRTLAAVFPRLGVGAPMVGDEVVPRVLDEPEDQDGVLAHWHWSADRWDPGPGFDWNRLGLDRAPAR